jgi:hypothetical protein
VGAEPRQQPPGAVMDAQPTPLTGARGGALLPPLAPAPAAAWAELPGPTQLALQGAGGHEGAQKAGRAAEPPSSQPSQLQQSAQSQPPASLSAWLPASQPTQGGRAEAEPEPIGTTSPVAAQLRGLQVGAVLITQPGAGGPQHRGPCPCMLVTVRCRVAHCKGGCFPYIYLCTLQIIHRECAHPCNAN